MADIQTTNQEQRERNATADEIAATGTLGSWIVDFESTHHLKVRGFSLKRNWQGWNLCIRATLAGDDVVAFAHLWRLSELGTVARGKIEGDDWKFDKYSSPPSASPE
jgi:hypothetical protein